MCVREIGEAKVSSPCRALNMRSAGPADTRRPQAFRQHMECLAILVLACEPSIAPRKEYTKTQNSLESNRDEEPISMPYYSIS